MNERTMASLHGRTEVSLRRELKELQALRRAKVANWSDMQREQQIMRELVRRQVTGEHDP